MKKSQKEIKVLAINTLYEYAQQFLSYEKDHFKQFLGKNIFKVDGSVMAKYQHERMSINTQLSDGTHVSANYWFESRYSFDIVVKICVNGGSYDVQPVTAFTQYEQMTITIFDIDKKDGSICEARQQEYEWLNKRFTVEQLQQQAAEVQEIAKQYESASNAFPYLFKQTFDIERLTR